MTVAVIGAGYWGRKHIAEYLALGEDVVACDLSAQNLEYARHLGASAEREYRRVLEGGTDCISICTPNASHFKIALEAIRGGKHVLVEKPMALSYAEADLLEKEATKMRTLLTVGHIFRFNNAVQKARDIVQGGSAGRLLEIKVAMTNQEYLFQPDFYKRIGDRTVLTDLGVHAFDIIYFIAGEFMVPVSAVGGSHLNPSNPDSMFVTGSVQNALCSMELSWITPPKTRRAWVVCSEKTLDIDCAKQTVSSFEGEKQTQVPIEPSNVIREELAHFLDCARNEKPSAAPARAGVESVRFIEEVERIFRRV